MPDPIIIGRAVCIMPAGHAWSIPDREGVSVCLWCAARKIDPLPAARRMQPSGIAGDPKQKREEETFANPGDRPWT